MPLTPARPSGAEGFDFLAGDWRVRHRKLARRLRGCEEWIEFDGLMASRPLLGGAGNLDENILGDPSGAYRAITLRIYDAATRTWAIWWLDGRHLAVGPPVHGRFAGGTGHFTGDDEFEGRPIRVHFLWSDILRSSPRWEQAFSADGGRSWEVNWVMRFERRSG